VRSIIGAFAAPDVIHWVRSSWGVVLAGREGCRHSLTCVKSRQQGPAVRGWGAEGCVQHGRTLREGGCLCWCCVLVALRLRRGQP
jgi:hypothetical protein